MIPKADVYLFDRGVKEAAMYSKTTVALALFASFTHFAAYAGDGPGGYPQKPIRLIVPFLAGGATDLMARSMAKELASIVGQPVVVDNRAGAGGSIGAEAAAVASTDGYTLLYSTMGVLTINPSLYKQLKYDPVTNFRPVAMTHVTSNLLVVHPSLGVKSVSDLVALARSKPGTLSFSSAGNGTSSHLSGELFKAVAKVDLLHISYKGTAASLPDLMAGRVQMTFDTASNFVDILQTGKLQPLAVTSRKRLAHMPGVPSMSETQAFSEYEVSLWLGVLAPAGTSPGIVRYLNRQLAAVMQHPGMLASLRPLGIEPLHGSPEDFARAIDQDRRKWAAVIKAADIQAD